MINVLISGANGRMGKNVYSALSLNEKAKAVCGFDTTQDLSNASFPVYDDLNTIKEKIDVLIDFSHPSSLDKILDYALKNNVRIILCATGYTQTDLEKIQTASQKIAVFRSGNMSLGVNVLLDLVAKTAKALYDFDIEIIEKHHNQKVDAPSGTALMLADSVKNALPEKYYTYGRQGQVGKRDKNEIGIHAVRGGNIVGEHQVVFAGENEVVTISHQAFDRKVFANGAVSAAIYIADKPAGMYDMLNVINGK